MLTVIDRAERLAEAKPVEGPRKFATLDMLRWRNERGEPSLVLLNVDSLEFHISVKSKVRDNRAVTELAIDIPKGELRECYRDVIENLKLASILDGKPHTIACTYAGGIPASTMEKIEKAKKKFASVHVAAPGKNFKHSSDEDTHANYDDPLVVGWDGYDLWLIDRFDLAPLEKLLATEFTE
jgi:hypothetical protein